MALTVYGVKKLGWTMALTQSWDKVLLALAAFLALTLTKINPALVILAAAIFGYLVYR
jgi:chromate transport protein ChrA